jgi:hypothetical protein
VQTSTTLGYILKSRGSPESWTHTRGYDFSVTKCAGGYGQN